MKTYAHIGSYIAVLLAALMMLPISASGAEPATTTKAATAAKSTTADKSAAARRAESSAYEREKLDQSAFATETKESEKAADKDSGSAFGKIFRGILGLAVVLGLIYGVQYAMKRWGKNKISGVSGNLDLIDVVATTNLAQGRALHVVRVGDELILIGATEHAISRIGELPQGAVERATGNEFETLITANNLTVAEPLEPAATGTFMSRFVENLRLQTAR